MPTCRSLVEKTCPMRGKRRYKLTCSLPCNDPNQATVCKTQDRWKPKKYWTLFQCSLIKDCKINLFKLSWLHPTLVNGFALRKSQILRLARLAERAVCPSARILCRLRYMMNKSRSLWVYNSIFTLSRYKYAKLHQFQQTHTIPHPLKFGSCAETLLRLSEMGMSDFLCLFLLLSVLSLRDFIPLNTKC